VTIPDSFLIRTDGDRVDTLIDCIYDSFSASYYCLEYLAARAIVCPTNAVVDAINDRVASRVPLESREYLSADRVAPRSEQIPNVDMLYTEDILNAITQPNYPEHRLVLKVGMPVILMRSLNQGIGLCNGTRLLITRLANCVFRLPL
jgi:ATP-dependent DNA helicase PIF1